MMPRISRADTTSRRSQMPDEKMIVRIQLNERASQVADVLTELVDICCDSCRLEVQMALSKLMPIFEPEDKDLK